MSSRKRRLYKRIIMNKQSSASLKDLEEKGWIEPNIHLKQYLTPDYIKEIKTKYTILKPDIT